MSKIIDFDKLPKIDESGWWYKDNPNNFSNWYYPLIKGCGNELNIPKTFVFTVPDDVLDAMYDEDASKEYKTVYNWLLKNVMPELSKDMIGKRVFVKNGTFSGKFNSLCFAWCKPDSLARAFSRINYDALLYDAGGHSEFVIRELIHIDTTQHPCIYHGLPLVPEFRVFYDFDNHKSLYCVNYWDYDYCRPALYDKTDIVVFEHEKEYLNRLFNKYEKQIMNKVDMFMKTVKMSGIWSVDIMYNQEQDEFWLIDMACGQESAYWDENKL